ncbi:hypothetical protein FRC03_010844 [Tulasnella sp. 419]|nr:hypothetical protein FRC03_010844 [Tulasnella sp. 419]
MTILWVEELGSDQMEMTLGGNCEEGGLKQMAEGGQSLWSGLEKKRKMPDRLPEVNESHKKARSMMGTVNDVEKNTTERSPEHGASPGATSAPQRGLGQATSHFAS